jgi:cell wall-associated NlpC family hydrolase
MTYQEFLDKYNWQYVDYDKYYGYQCVDLMRQYIKDVFDLNPYQVLPPAPGAKQIYQRYNTGYPFKKIPNTREAIPINGDIIFWGWYWGLTGPNGHVGIVVGDGSSVNNFISFDQNWPRGSACHRQLHDYRGVMGWLRKV